MVHHVAVFCASSNLVDSVYHNAARATGSILARAGMTVYYGGGKSGLMGSLADAVLAERGKIIGIQPSFMKEQKWFHPDITELEVVTDMAERKKRIFSRAEAIIALPGGCGTLDELLEAITLKQLGQYTWPLVILNTGHYFDPLLAQLQRMVDEHFMRPEHQQMWQVIDNPEELLSAIDNSPGWSSEHIQIAQL